MTLLKNISYTLLITGIFALHPSLNKGDNPITYLQHFVYGNSLNVSTNSTIHKEFIEIKWMCETENSACKNVVIFKNGKQINDIPSEQGNQKLIVFYKSAIVGEVPQHKTSKEQAHLYKIELLSKKNSLFFNGEIIGPSPYKGRPTTIIDITS